MINVYASKGRIFTKDDEISTFLCGTYLVGIPKGTATSFILSAMFCKVVEEKDLLSKIDNARAKVDIIDALFYGRASAEAIKKLEQANLIVKGRGKTGVEALFNLLDQVSIWPMIRPSTEDEEIIEMMPERFAALKDPSLLSPTEKIVLDIVNLRGCTLKDISLKTVHSEEFYKKTYITMETLQKHPDLIHFSKEVIYDAVISLFNRSLLVFNDKIPRFFYPKGTSESMYKQYIVDGNMKPKMQFYF